MAGDASAVARVEWSSAATSGLDSAVSAGALRFYDDADTARQACMKAVPHPLHRPLLPASSPVARFSAHTCTGDRPDPHSRYTIGPPGATWKGAGAGAGPCAPRATWKGGCGRARGAFARAPPTPTSHNPAHASRVAASSRTARLTRATSTRCGSTSRRMSATCSSRAAAQAARDHLRMARGEG